MQQKQKLITNVEVLIASFTKRNIFLGYHWKNATILFDSKLEELSSVAQVSKISKFSDLL